METAFVIGSAASEGLAAARDLLRDAGLPLAGFDTSWRAWTATAPDGEVLGAVALERHDDPTLPGGAAFLLRSLVVAPDRRSSGLGAALVDAALAGAREATASPVVALLTETADGYFDRFGFRGVTRDALPVALGASAELAGACSVSARAYLLA